MVPAQGDLAHVTIPATNPHNTLQLPKLFNMRRSARLSRNTPDSELDSASPMSHPAPTPAPAPKKPKRLPLKDRPRPEYPYELIHRMPVTQHIPDAAELTNPLDLVSSKSLGYSVHASRNAYLNGAMFDTVWSRKPNRTKGEFESNPLNRTLKLCDCVFIMGPHRFLGKLFTVKEEDAAAPRPRVVEAPPQSGQKLVIRLREMAQSDPVLKSLMAEVASGKASPQLVAEFQKYMQKAREMDSPTKPDTTISSQSKPGDKANGLKTEERQSEAVKENTKELGKEAKEGQSKGLKAETEKDLVKVSTKETEKETSKESTQKTTNETSKVSANEPIEIPVKRSPKESVVSGTTKEPAGPSVNRPSSVSAPCVPQEKPTYLAFEFNDNPSERFVFPRDSIPELLANTDILLSFLCVNDGEYTPLTITIRELPPRFFPTFEKCFEPEALARKHMTEIMQLNKRAKNHYVWYQVDKTDALVLDEIRKMQPPYFALQQPKRQYKTRKYTQKYSTSTGTSESLSTPASAGTNAPKSVVVPSSMSSTAPLSTTKPATSDKGPTESPAPREAPRPKLNLPDINSIRIPTGGLPPLPKSLQGLIPRRENQ